ncbi:hypothetical protein ACIRF8_08750 [Streptomyces sp. NPDC102406]|uniref:hypothetical protein n=1 Tax=Streptomyces sp. NPDC102406 TaxID=3366171 RepID=UPI0037FEE5E8
MKVVGDGSGSGGVRGAQVAVDTTTALESWAQATCDERVGLPFSLYVMHRVMIGDTLLGKPLMGVFCRLAARKQELTASVAACWPACTT